jgi:hypothetical protein
MMLQQCVVAQNPQLLEYQKLNLPKKQKKMNLELGLK